MLTDDLLFMLEQTGDMMELLDADGRLLFVNAPGRRMLGLDGPVPAGLALGRYTPADFLGQLRSIGAGGPRRWQGETQIVNLATGQAIRLNRKVVALGGADGAPAGYLMLSRPIAPQGSHIRPQDALAQMEAEARELAFTLKFAIAAARGFVFEWNIAENKVHRRLGQPGTLPPTAPEGDPLEAFLAYVYPDDLPVMRDVIAQALAEPGRRYEVNYRVLRPDGSVAWLHEAGQAEAGEDGTPRRMIGISRDITDFMETQIRLTQSQELLQQNMSELEQLYARAPLGLDLLDAELRFVRINEALAEMNGLSVADHLGKTAWDLLPDLRASAEPALREVLDKGEVKLDVRVVGTTAAQPGVMREWREQFYPIRNLAGGVIGIGIVCEEVTQRIRLESDLRESEGHLRKVLDRLIFFVATLTPEGMVVEINRAPLDVAAVRRCDVIGRPFVETYWWSFDPQAQARLRDSIAAALQGSPVRYDTPVRVADDRWIIIDFQIAPLRDEQGRITHLVTSGVPVDERIAAEAQLRALNESLERRVEDEVRRREAAHSALVQSQKLDALGQLTAGIAHDFNNVVAATAGGFHLIQKWTDQDKIRQVAKLGTEAAQRGGELVKHLLTFARQQVLTPQSVELHGLIANLAPLIAQSLGRGISLAIDCPGSIGLVNVDPVQLETALINLAVNARDAMPQGGELRITAIAQPPHGADRPPELGERDAIAIIVRDDGHGMAPDVLNRALEPFFTTKEPGKGTGLGLAMVHGFAQQSGGALRIESEPERGTSVTLWLPRTQLPETEAPPPDTAPAPAPRQGRSILLIDDDDLVRTVTAHQLQELGYRVKEAANGDRAIQLLDEGHGFDLVLCDVIMPREGGPAVAARIRQRWPALPIIFMTGHAEREQLQGEAILDKPFTPRQLIEHIERNI